MTSQRELPAGPCCKCSDKTKSQPSSAGASPEKRVTFAKMWDFLLQDINQKLDKLNASAIDNIRKRQMVTTPGVESSWFSVQQPWVATNRADLRTSSTRRSFDRNTIPPGRNEAPVYEAGVWPSDLVSRSLKRRVEQPIIETSDVSVNSNRRKIPRTH